MQNLKIHAKLKWTTIIDRLNKSAGFEKFSIQHDSIYALNENEEVESTEIKEIYDQQKNPVFPALTQNVFAGHKETKRQVLDNIKNDPDFSVSQEIKNMVAKTIEIAMEKAKNAVDGVCYYKIGGETYCMKYIPTN